MKNFSEHFSESDSSLDDFYYDVIDQENLIKIFDLSSKLIWFFCTVMSLLRVVFPINGSIMLESLHEESLVA